ncbi:hypothetical protein RJ641_031800 [Dillenia turbinata]|uniref:Uncharacterized protein n=1 Tax=Dillenia turbinata TaxID=194707 RepID=A0AAN8W3A7_9MAGN
MDLAEGVGESSSPPRSFVSFSSYDIRTDVYNRLIETGNEDAVCNPDLREQLEAHFNKLPPSYGLDVNMERVEDVLLHQKVLLMAKDPEKRPVYHIRFVEVSLFLIHNHRCGLISLAAVDGLLWEFEVAAWYLENGDGGSKVRFDHWSFWTTADGCNDQESLSIPSTSGLCAPADNEEAVPSHSRHRKHEVDFEPCSKLEDLNLDVRRNSGNLEKGYPAENTSERHGATLVHIHEVIFSTVDKPKLLSQVEV